MPAILAILAYVVAIGIPVFLLQRFHSRHWFWHTLAIVAAVGLGFIPIPQDLQRPGHDLLFGSVFVALMIWGAGGLILYHTRGHRERHA
jgi:hypothetical protein